MNEALLRYLLESTACLLCFYVFFWAVLRKETCFQFNRFYLLGSVLLAFSLPFLPLPTWVTATESVSQLSPALPIGMQVLEGEVVDMATTSEAFNYWYLAYALYGVGVLFFAGRLLLQVVKLQRLSRKSGVAYFLPKNTKLVYTNGQLPTFSFLNTIYLDNTQHWAEGEEEQVLAHELVHIREGHSWDILFVSAVEVLFWFNPLLLFYKKALEQTHEFIADATVIQTANAHQYSSLLLKQVFQKMDFRVGNLFFNKSLTLSRLKMMKKTNRSLPVLKLAVVVPVLGLLVAGLSAYRPADYVAPLNKLKEEKAEHKADILQASKEPEALKSSDSKVSIVESEKEVQKPSIQPDMSAAAPIKPHPRQSEVKTIIPQDTLPEKVYVAVQKMPEFPGGQKAMFTYMAENFKIPAASQGLKGTLVASLVVSAKGEISQVSILKSLNPVLDKEMIRVIRSMPKWNPGMQNGKAVTVKYTIPFVLNASSTQPNKTAAGVDGKPFVVVGEKPSQVVDERIFVAVEQMPSFVGGQEKMYKFIHEQFQLPADAKGVKGTVVVSIVVTETGEVTKPELLKKLHPSVDKELVRVLLSMPKWEPGMQNGKAVSVKYTIPYRVEPKN